MARASFQICPAGANDPISLFRQLNNIPMATGLLPEFASTKRAIAEIRVGRESVVMLNDIGENFHHNLFYQFGILVARSVYLGRTGRKRMGLFVGRVPFFTT